MTVLNRRPGAASVTTLGVLSLAVSVAQLVAPRWSERAGLDVWNYSALVAEGEHEAARRADLGDVHARLHEQSAAADHVAGRVIDGRLSLAEASAEVERINADRPSFRDGLLASYPEATTHPRRLAAYVMHKVTQRLLDDPARRAEVLGRLQAEYARLPE